VNTHLDKRTAVLLDQYPLWLETLAQVVERVGVDVVAKTNSSSAALAVIEARSPNLLITGIKTPEADVDGVGLICRARELHPELKVIVLSMYDDPQLIEAAFAAGAVAYVLKTAHPDDLTSAVRQAFEHSIYLAGARPARAPAARPTDSPGLTRRELEILRLVAEGHSNAELARMLWVTEQTVKFHLSNIYRKLNVSNRTEASRWAQVHGLLPTQTASGAASAA